MSQGAVNMAKRKTEEVYLSIAQVTERLKTGDKPLSKRTLLRWLKAGKFPGAHKLGDHTSPWRIPESSVNNLIKAKSTQAK